MQNNQVLDGLEDYIERQKQDNSLRIEVRMGTIVPKTEEALLDLQYFQDGCVNVESKIEKKNYRFEAAISREDFEKAQRSIKSDDRWEFTLDLIFPISYTVSISYRIGIDEEGKIFCYERRKEIKDKHLDVIDEQRQYRISLNAFNVIDYHQTNLCVEKIRDLLKDNKNIGCIRYKQTKIFYSDDDSEQFIFQVQQVDKNKQAFLVEIAQAITNINNTFKKNVESALGLLKENQYYYKPFYEAEISLKQNIIAQSASQLAQKYQEKIRQFHDNVRLMNPRLSMNGGKDHQPQKKFSPNHVFKQNQHHRGSTRGRGNNRPENNQRQPQLQQQQVNYSNILDDLNLGTEQQVVEQQQQPKQQQMQSTNYRGRGRGRGQRFHKDREEKNLSDNDDQYQSRTEDYL